ncbi:hypothetical protein [Mesorhizobium sp. NZP2077]|uniref:hypothetical protein n=1 Tax=Mesorhizobium sp. NZP2077 TaxID=2483404 RepID=UPI00155466FA|nr:hypothetical protein [Mesorhizobium sp. NZP2077]QKC82807.1 hypothetical protein EB232_15360 [Mesorhizobium sp. NZP2077]QKD16304.1 hypothetical protein HGP13_15160 [Mesorhizobium sp. NZP2077]
MPDTPAFVRRLASLGSGRSTAPAAPGQTGTARTSSPPRPAPVETGEPSEHARQLGAVSGTILFAGELLAFVGMIVAFLATQWWPADPASLSGLGGSIYIPDLLQKLIAFIDPMPRPHMIGIGVTEIRLTDTIMQVILIAGAVSILRARWVLAGLICGFLAFPWPMIGYHFPSARVVLCLYAFIAVFAILRLPRRALFILIPVGALFGPLIIGVATSVFMQLFGAAAPPRVRYSEVAFAQLQANQGKPATEMAKNGKPVVRVTTLAGFDASSPQQQAAKAYVMAQELALRGDAAGAAQAARDALSGDFGANAFDRQRLATIMDFATAGGASGDAAKDTLLSSYQLHRTLAWAALVVGTLLCLIGPFAEIIATRIARRARRTDKVQRQLEAQRAELAGTSVNGTFGRAQSFGVQSIAAMDAVSVIAAIARRLRLYRLTAMALAGLALVSFYWAYALHLPPAAANGAFDNIALIARAGEFWKAAGLAASANFPLPTLPWTLVGMMTSPLSLFALAVIVLTRFRKYARFVLAGFAVLLLMVPLQQMAPVATPAQPATASAFGPELRAALLQAAGQPAPAIDGLRTSTPEQADLPPIDGSVAAYTLAQIAYVENRPADAGMLLARIVDPGVLMGRINNQRADLMLEWAQANGYPARGLDWTPNLPQPMAETRATGQFFLIAGLALLALLAATAALIAIAGRRLSRISSLVDARRQMQASIDAAW